jgi:hypothetical protein
MLLLMSSAGIRENLMGEASAVTWLILVFYVPMVIVSRVALIWRLYARRREELDQDRGREFGGREAMA